MGPLVVGYDGTPGARAALTEADRLAGELGDGHRARLLRAGQPHRRRGARLRGGAA